MVPVAGGADASGYMNFARLLGEGALVEPLRMPEGAAYEEISKELFQPLGYTYRSESGQLSPTYPIGLPLLLSLGGLHESEVLGRAVYAGVSVLACIGIWFLAAELGISRRWRFYAVAMLATSPLLLWGSLIVMSDVLATCLAIWVLLCALRSRKSKRAALLCGVFLGWAVLVRPSNVLLFGAVVVALLQGRANWKRWALGIVGGLPAFFLFLWSNWKLYGDPLQSGYGDLWSLFSWAYGPETLLHYGRTLLYAVFVLVLPTAIAGASKWRSGPVRLLLSWAIPVFAFYAFYLFTSQTWWFLRFILPALPALALLSAIFLEEWSSKVLPEKRQSWLALALAGASVVAAIYWEGRLNIFGEQDFERRYAKECSWANANLAANTLVVCMQPSGSFYYYTDFPVFRWDLAKQDANWASLLQASRASATPVVAVLHEFEELRDDSILKRYPERWELIGEVSPRIRAYRMR